MDYIPRRRADQKNWWINLRDQIETEGPKIGLTPAEVTEAKAVATAMVAAMDETDAKDVALAGARAAERATRAVQEADIRLKVRNWKSRPTYPSSGVEGTLPLRGPESGFDPATFKPTLRVTVTGGQVKLDFVKQECDSVAVYGRLRGEMGWMKLGLDSATPYYDTRPLAQANVPETREYYVIGVIDDEEVGVPSDIASAVFGG